uniref:Putative capsid n=1 Tax=uncultured virus TaxID=340016 RepID=A0A1D8MK74_9VIRU|nr:putative capsid [uncultured virus]
MKRRASPATKKEFKKRKISGSSTYGTVPRTRGVYAIGEHKYFDQNIEVNPFPSSSSWTNTMVEDPTVKTLFAPSQGAAINQRIGREVDIHKIRINGNITMDPDSAVTAGIGAEVLRLALVIDSQTNATQMTGAQLYNNGSTTAYWQNFQNLDNFGRFRVLKDKLIVIDDPNLGTSAVAGTDIRNGKSRTFKWTISFKKPLRVRFNGTNGGTIADIVDNSIHLVGNSTSVGGSNLRLQYTSRIVYCDA